MKLRNWGQAIGLAVMVIGAASSAQAEPWGHFGRHDGFYGRDFHHFDPHERAIWRGGHWFNRWHDGRFGWWWVVDGYWYFYPAPVYPYPTYVPPAIIVQQPPPVPAGLPPATSWYYCSNPRGYYPYVASCRGPWTQVPATPRTPTPLKPVAPK